ncbi:hypothetical protein GW846_05975 [Candidatus Gracilibacteria bacterium]|nr:hypothetical protein [Candidatus Gracilibacteria bacterium]
MKQLGILLILSLLLVGCNKNTSEQEDPMITSEDVIVNQESEVITQEETIDQEIPEVEEALPTLDLSTAIFDGNGTEPFWGFSASGSTLVLREPSNSGPISLTSFTGVVMTNVGTSVNMTTSGMTLNLVLGTCSDGMSDMLYAYSSTFVAGSTSYTGCANVD